jgi:hypothetical protein
VRERGREVLSEAPRIDPTPRINISDYITKVVGAGPLTSQDWKIQERYRCHRVCIEELPGKEPTRLMSKNCSADSFTSNVINKMLATRCVSGAVIISKIPDGFREGVMDDKFVY